MLWRFLWTVSEITISTYSRAVSENFRFNVRLVRLLRRHFRLISHFIRGWCPFWNTNIVGFVILAFRFNFVAPVMQLILGLCGQRMCISGGFVFLERSLQSGKPLIRKPKDPSLNPQASCGPPFSFHLWKLQSSQFFSAAILDILSNRGCTISSSRPASLCGSA